MASTSIPAYHKPTIATVQTPGQHMKNVSLILSSWRSVTSTKASLGHVRICLATNQSKNPPRLASTRRLAAWCVHQMHSILNQLGICREHAATPIDIDIVLQADADMPAKQD